MMIHKWLELTEDCQAVMRWLWRHNCYASINRIVNDSARQNGDADRNEIRRRIIDAVAQLASCVDDDGIVWLVTQDDADGGATRYATALTADQVLDESVDYLRASLGETLTPKH